MPHLDGIAVLDTIKQDPESIRYAYHYADSIRARGCHGAGGKPRRILFHAETV